MLIEENILKWCFSGMSHVLGLWLCLATGMWYELSTCSFYSILSYNLGRSFGQDRLFRNNPFPHRPVFSCPS